MKSLGPGCLCIYSPFTVILGFHFSTFDPNYKCISLERGPLDWKKPSRMILLDFQHFHFISFELIYFLALFLYFSVGPTINRYSQL